MRIPIFLSTPKCHLAAQEAFLAKVEEALKLAGLEPRPLGRSDYDMDAPLTAIRRLMMTSCGILTLAFRRTYIEAGVDRPKADLGELEARRDGTWLTSPYCQIEPAMAFQIGLPALIWRETGVAADGLLDRGAMGLSMPEFDISKPDEYLQSDEWSQPFRSWVARVHGVYERRGTPPALWE